MRGMERAKVEGQRGEMEVSWLVGGRLTDRLHAYELQFEAFYLARTVRDSYFPREGRGQAAVRLIQMPSDAEVGNLRKKLLMHQTDIIKTRDAR
jgi:hypothetical protein